MGSTDTDIEELENATYKYLIGEQTEKMWQRLKGILRCLVKQLEKGDVNVVDLKKNIEYAASVLEAVYIDETRSSSNLIPSESLTGRCLGPLLPVLGDQTSISMGIHFLG
ncbi:phosphodiesterase 1A, calmodulin-dependent, isoform CRA_c [Mus musculus]|nr:phosphodiesterase 1A, calmodulin-dependent, isoform CRA_c [Mus musculus]